ncbi:hypothetical protein M4I32_08865 [Microbacterium sp. LRZ72]|uniref:TadE family type IV pilus minor pilin n=1 Tax=Microbacterium sp. LRZ72 TaxID=2942481 RepID=UPI0029A6A601|nr:TadE family type IV pilus minor pilin [Microbacterium sp. LRZ72]MDX2376906.1 hypothetical protein [Microbacterium sp. LRZ72]
MTAEVAVALPAFVLVVLLGLGALGAGARAVRMQDAAADAARALGRGDSTAVAVAAVAATSPTAGLAVDRPGELVCVTVTDRARIGVIDLPVQGRSCALTGGR